MGTEIRIAIVDDHPVVVKGLSALIKSEEGMVVAGQAGNGEDAILLIRNTEVDIVLLDVVMPHKGGLDIISDLKNDKPELRIIMLSSFGEYNSVISAFKAGADGYLLKDTPPDQLLNSIRDVYDGNASCHPEIARTLISEINKPDTSQLNPVESLTEREIEVLSYLSTGIQNSEIGENLFISERTVRSHVGKILRKLHLKNRTQAALYAFKMGYGIVDET